MKTRAVAAPAPPSGRGEVVLVGGGIGDPDLITVAGLHELRSAEVVVHDRLAPLALLEGLSAELIDVGKIPRGEFTPQERINQVLIEHAAAGRKVVRLKGGDSFVFGRGGEEWLACAEAGIGVRTVPGISSAIAAAELAGVPVTHRGLSQGFTVVSGHVAPGDPRGDLDWAALARTGTTLVILMGVGTLPKICATLIEHGLSPDTPAITVADAGLPSMRTIRAPLAEIAATVEREGLGAPAVTIIGAVAGLRLE
ncbi:uroporphyrinogen-III C-methyltransferase [Granulicoccus phenolivorans]|uniref:uroporphyrinogen-III C-methyltransferase n=1 Tax=Granulicoccus phenolivorans TaxID=266854 RepID=UPI001FDF9ABD|nr:uroporphyrinogen-III C-methyltransferase [Granulicoccus phenolivorans]